MVDNRQDVVVEAANPGIDKVIASITHTLANNIENLNLGGNTSINATGNSLDNIITGNQGSNTLKGGVGNDILDGGVGNDILDGGVGNDILDGGVGKDTLNGGVGNDILVGGASADLLIGDSGRDRFRFNSPTEGIDSLQDFNLIDDTLEVSSTAFNIPLATLNASQFSIGTEATNSNHRFMYENNTGNLFFDRDGSGSIASVKIANLPTLVNLTANNIVGI
jgi:Ca2+-binding RTX toxin-like protein